MPSRNPFAEPRGPLGHIAGWILASGNDTAHQQVVRQLGIGSGDHVLELGYGPGRLIRLLLDSTSAGLVAGVEPAEVMLRHARRANRDHLDSERLDLRIGEAAHLPFPDDHFHRVVTVNTVAIWPDLGAGMAEIHRVLVDGGSVLVAWHSGNAPGRMKRVNALPESRLVQIRDTMAGVFKDVERRELGDVVAFTGTT